MFEDYNFRGFYVIFEAPMNILALKILVTKAIYSCIT